MEDQMENIYESFGELKYSSIKNYIDRVKYNYMDIDEQFINLIVNKLSSDSRKNVKSLAISLSKFIEKSDAEIRRVKSMYDFDKRFGSNICIAGTDEVGRGPLAGPIVAGAVALKLDYKNDKDLILGIKDSKKLSHKSREELCEIIKARALYYNIEEINNEIIDLKGIAWSNNEVLKKACLGLNAKPDFVLSDGYLVRNLNVSNECVIKGDAKSASIACASIIAKVHRDRIMAEYSKIYPNYGFERNAGYGTEEHIRAIKTHGPCILHRISFLKNIL